mgnify:FL=1|jgi:hypothetical protein|tara:strand:- start:4979 stop:6586 length:1608 start_codon:yes stop_codon:yes gene_type:complete
MPESVTYGSYTFPTPTPLVGQGVNPTYLKGKLDYFIESVDLVGNLTGENLSGLHLQKMRMISGLMPEYQTLSITHGSSTTGFAFSRPESINFANSDLTTVLPYSVSFTCYKSGTFSEFFGVGSPQDEWSFSEEEGKITNVTHTVSAQGLKVDSKEPLVNARNFVSGRIVSGCLDLSLFQTGGNAFLMSRNESIDRSTNTYGITENYKYSTSENPVTDSGIFTSNTQISYDKDAGLSVSVNASIQGSLDANITGGLVHTGLFTADQASEIALQAVASSLSDYESGIYTFISTGRSPNTVSYAIDTGSNKIDFVYNFQDPDNLDQSGNVLHTKSSSVSASKDQSTVNISVQGQFRYNSPFEIMGTGDPATGQRFIEINQQYSGLATGSGFFNLAVEALQDFRGDATGYHISGDYVNPEPLSTSVNKQPAQSIIDYSFEFDNRIDLSSGTLSGLQVSTTDKKPIELSGIVPSIGGFAKQKLIKRTIGEFTVSATCEASTGELQTLIDVASGYATGIFSAGESSSLNDQTISYNMSRFY